MIYSGNDIEKLYQDNLKEAYDKLASLLVVEGRRLKIKGLNGTIYEQVIRYCLFKELHSIGLMPTMNEQRTLDKFVIDLSINNKIDIEIKAGGIFSKDGMIKYEKYRTRIEQDGHNYFYVTRSESYKPYQLKTTLTFGQNRAFFLDKDGEWERFVEEIKELL
jgi:hypothetical protein